MPEHTLELFYLSTCDTSRRIMRQLEVHKFPFRFQDIKTEKITPAQIDRLSKLAGGYAPLFSKVAIKYRSMRLKEKQPSEMQIRELILAEYTFLKRPVFIIDDTIFIGNAPGNIRNVQSALSKIKT